MRFLWWIIEWGSYISVALFGVYFIVKISVGDFSKNPHVNEVLKSFSMWVKRKLRTGEQLTSHEREELVRMREVLANMQRQQKNLPPGVTLEQLNALLKRIAQLEARAKKSNSVKPQSGASKPAPLSHSPRTTMPESVSDEEVRAYDEAMDEDDVLDEENEPWWPREWEEEYREHEPGSYWRWRKTEED